MTWLRKLDTPFPFYLNDDRKNLIFVAVVSVFVFVFLLLFETSGVHHLELNTLHKAIFGVVTFLGLAFSVVFLPKWFPAAFDPVQWTVRKYILHTILNVAIIGILCTIVDELYISPGRSLWENFRGANKQVVIIGSIPVILISLFLRNIMLKENLANAIRANSELEKIKNMKEGQRSNRANVQPITLHSETTEKFTFNLSDLLFIQAGDNYSTVVWKNADGVQRKLLRTNLRNLENQINNPYAIRVHRSFIINVNAIISISGNTNGYKLQMADTEELVPVSRQKGRDIIEKIQQIRNVLELS